jgi:hypothetical protein
LFPDKDGKPRLGLVTTATVAEEEGLAYCGVTLDGAEKAGIYTFPLTREELEAYRRHPDTCFGVPAQRKTRVDSLIEFYDFCFENYGTCRRKRCSASQRFGPIRSASRRSGSLSSPACTPRASRSRRAARRTLTSRRARGERGEELLTAVSGRQLSTSKMPTRERGRRGRVCGRPCSTSDRETLANLPITRDLRCFSNQPVAEIVQCGEPRL